ESYEQKSSRRWDIRHPDPTSNFGTKVCSARVFESRQHGLARHRHFFPRSSSASHFTAGAFGSSSPLGRRRQGDQSLIACGGSKTVTITVQTPSADCPCGGTGRVCVEIYSISADGTRGVAVAIFVGGYALVANRTRRPAGAVAISRPSPSYCRTDQCRCSRCDCRQCLSYNQIDPCEGGCFGRTTEERKLRAPAKQERGAS